MRATLGPGTTQAAKRARQNHEASAHDALRSLSRAFRDDVDAVATYAGVSGRVGNAYRRGARTFAALSYLVLDHLTLMEFLDTDSLELRVMEEKLVASFPLNKSKTSIRNQFLDPTLWHFCPPVQQA